jgi:hypothetical protein
VEGLAGIIACTVLTQVSRVPSFELHVTRHSTATISNACCLRGLRGLHLPASENNLELTLKIATRETKKETNQHIHKVLSSHSDPQFLSAASHHHHHRHPI